MRTYHPVYAVLTGASLVLTALGGCAGFYSVDVAGSGATATAGGDPIPGSADIADGFGNGAATAGAGGNVPPPPDGGSPYGAYCGGDSAPCMPGTSDCTPGGNPNMSSGSGGSIVACQLVALGGEVTAKCDAVGTAKVGELCKSASHCVAGLGCANTVSVGVCRQYCCDEPEACPSNTYCAMQPMTEAPTVSIPVCAPVTNCKLLDNSGCAANEACTIVRKDGTTSCVTPGTGTRDEPCPCAAGYVCNSATAKCVKLCHIGKDEIDCAGGACQGGVMVYPEGFGVCVF